MTVVVIVMMNFEDSGNSGNGMVKISTTIILTMRQIVHNNNYAYTININTYMI